MICPTCKNTGVQNTCNGKDFWYCRTCKDEIYLEEPKPAFEDKKPDDSPYGFKNSPQLYFYNGIGGYSNMTPSPPTITASVRRLSGIGTIVDQISMAIHNEIRANPLKTIDKARVDFNTWLDVYNTQSNAPPLLRITINGVPVEADNTLPTGAVVFELS